MVAERAALTTFRNQLNVLDLRTRSQCPSLWEGHKVSSQVVPSALGTDISLSDDSLREQVSPGQASCPLGNAELQATGPGDQVGQYVVPSWSPGIRPQDTFFGGIGLNKKRGLLVFRKTEASGHVFFGKFLHRT